MIRPLLLAALLAGLACPALAADCKRGDPNARLLGFDPPRDSAVRAGLTVALAFGLDPGSFPAKDIAENPRDCARGRIDTGVAGPYTLFGSDTVLPLRWAENAGNPGRIAYLAQLPRPQAALAWAAKHGGGENSAQFGDADMIYVLAVTDGADRRLYAWFETEPDDTTLATAMCGALTGQLPLLGIYDTDTGEATFTGAVTPPLSQVAGCRLTK